MILRVFIAAILGGIIGFEREYRAKEAGLRTHFLVAMGSALFMILSQYGFDDLLGVDSISLDPSRIASQVVTGIGFIGAGTIIFQKHRCWIMGYFSYRTDMWVWNVFTCNNCNYTCACVP